MHKVKTNINVLCTRMKNWIPCYMRSTLIVMIQLNTFHFTLSFPNKCLSHIVFMQACIAAIYFISIIDKVTIDYKFDSQPIALPAMESAYLMVECLLFLFPAKFALIKPTHYKVMAHNRLNN